MLGAVLASFVALATPGAQSGDGAALVQLTQEAACRDAATLVRAGARAVAPELRLYRLDRSALPLVSRLRERGSVALATSDRPAGRLTATAVDDTLVPEEWWRDQDGLQG